MKKGEPMNVNDLQSVEDDALEQVDGGLFNPAGKVGQLTCGGKPPIHDLVFHPEKDKGAVKRTPSLGKEGEVIKLSGGPLPAGPFDDPTACI